MNNRDSGVAADRVGVGGQKSKKGGHRTVKDV